MPREVRTTAAALGAAGAPATVSLGGADLCVRTVRGVGRKSTESGCAIEAEPASAIGTCDPPVGALPAVRAAGPVTTSSPPHQCGCCNHSAYSHDSPLLALPLRSTHRDIHIAVTYVTYRSRCVQQNSANAQLVVTLFRSIRVTVLLLRGRFAVGSKDRLISSSSRRR